MRRVFTGLLVAAAVLLPMFSAFGHVDTKLSAILDDQEIIVTGHDERDATLHIEAASGVVHQRCPECVLDKRRSGASRRAEPILALRPSGPRALRQESVGLGLERSADGPARAPPLVWFAA